jgi:hypothetical protein
MPRKKKKNVDVTLTEATSMDEALNYIWIGLKFVAKKHPKKTWLTLFVLLALVAFSGQKVIELYYTPKAVIEEAKPATASADTGLKLDFSIVTNAYAEKIQMGQRGIKLEYNGQPYGYADNSYIVSKVYGENKLIIYDKLLNKVFALSDGNLDNNRNQIMQQKK